MKFINKARETEWNDALKQFRETNPYSARIMEYAKKLAEAIEREMDNNPGVTVVNVAGKCANEVGEAIGKWSGYSLSRAVGLLEMVWPGGDQVRDPIENYAGISAR